MAQIIPPMQIVLLWNEGVVNFLKHPLPAGG